jgi:hypothetical protein
LMCRLDHAVVTGAEELAKLFAEFPIGHVQPFERLVMANPVFKVALR